MNFAARSPFGVVNRLSQKVAMVGKWVNVASSTAAGSSSSQPWMWICQRRMVRNSPLRSLSPVGRGRTSPIGPQQPVRLALGVLHRLLRRLGAGERRLQIVVEGLGDTLIVVGGELRHREGKLVACHRG